MAWYEAHQTLSKHPKTLKLASLIKCERRYAVGLLHDLFSWGLDAAKKDGSLPGLKAEDIASALDFSGKKGLAVIAALVDSGYLELSDGTFRIHDWYDYAGKLADRREADKRRKERGKNAEKTRKERGNPYATVPYRTVPYPYKEIDNNKSAAVPRPVSAEEDDGFDAFWEAYPRKSGDIRSAYMAYIGALQGGATPEVLMEALKWQSAEWEEEGAAQFIPSPEKWLTNRRWEEKPREKKPKKKKGVVTAAEHYSNRKNPEISLEDLEKTFEGI